MCKVHTRTVPDNGLLQGQYTVQVPSGQPSYCTVHTGVVTLCWTHRCCTPVKHTWLLYHCIANTSAVQASENAKKQTSHKRDTPWKDKSWIYHPFPQQSSRLSHPRRVISSKPCQYKRWQDWKNTMHIVSNSEEIKKCHLVQISKPSDSQCAAAWRYASNSASAACSTTLLRWSLWSTPSCDGANTWTKLLH